MSGKTDKDALTTPSTTTQDPIVENDDDDLLSVSFKKKTNRKNTAGRKTTVVAAEPVLQTDNESKTELLKKLETCALIQKSRQRGRGVAISADVEDSYFGDIVSTSMTGSGLSSADSDIYKKIDDTSSDLLASSTTIPSSTSKYSTNTSSSTIPSKQLESVFQKVSIGDESEQLRLAKEAYIAEKLHQFRDEELQKRTEQLKQLGVTDSSDIVTTSRTDDKDQENKIANIAGISTISNSSSSLDSNSNSNEQRSKNDEIDATEAGDRWLTGISEITLPIDVKLQNIERTKIATEEALRKRTRQIYENYMGEGIGGVAAVSGLHSHDVDYVLSSNVSSNYKRHKREYDTQEVYQDNIINYYDKDLQHGDNSGKSAEEIQKAAYERVLAYELQKHGSNTASDDKAVKRFIKFAKR